MTPIDARKGRSAALATPRRIPRAPAPFLNNKLVFLDLGVSPVSLSSLLPPSGVLDPSHKDVTREFGLKTSYAY